MMIVAMNRFGDSLGQHLAEPGGDVFGLIGVWVNECVSRGHVRLASADPFAQPVVEENMLADPRDMLRMMDAVRRLAVITAQPALSGIADWIRLADTDLSLPQAAALPDHELDAVLRRETGDIQHAAGSCRMSGVNDAEGVVNPDGTVKGISGLRVADASIMPTLTSGNTNAPSIMIGEKAARLVLEAAA